MSELLIGFALASWAFCIFWIARTIYLLRLAEKEDNE